MNATIAPDEDFEDEEIWPPWLKGCFGLLISLFILVNIVGNLLTIVAFFRDPKLQDRVQNIYIVNLAFTDLAVGLNSMPFYALYTISDFTWILGAGFCKVWLAIDFWVCAESSLTVILISYDRLLMVRDGIKYNQEQTTKRAVCKVAISWAASFLLYVPAIIGFDYWRGYSIVEEGDCDVEFASEFYFTFFTALLEFAVPFCLLSIFSAKLYSNIYKRSKSMKSLTREEDSGVKQKSLQLRRDKKAARSLIILIVSYAICWVPYTISTVIISLCEHCVDWLAYDCFTWLLWFNSSINPFLYAFTNRRFRMHYKRMMCLMPNKVRPMVVHIREYTVDSVASRVPEGGK